MTKPTTTYNVPSGLGGSFDVKVAAEFTNDILGEVVTLKVHSPRNRDWHGYTWTVSKKWFEQNRKAA